MKNENSRIQCHISTLRNQKIFKELRENGFFFYDFLLIYYFNFTVLFIVELSLFFITEQNQKQKASVFTTKLTKNVGLHGKCKMRIIP